MMLGLFRSSMCTSMSWGHPGGLTLGPVVALKCSSSGWVVEAVESPVVDVSSLVGLLDRLSDVLYASEIDWCV